MAEEKIIIDVQIDTDKAEKNVESLTEEIINLQIEQGKLTKKVNDGKLSEIEYQKELEKNKQQIKQVRQEQQANIKVLTAANKSIQGLRAANSALRKERDKVNTQTKEGRKRIKELNKEIDKNDKAIRKNSDSMAKQRLNIGNYTSALGPLGGAMQKVNGIMTLISKNPISIVLGALIGILATLRETFTRNQDAADKFQQKVAFLKGAFEGFKDVVADFGKNLIIRFRLIGIRAEILTERLKGNKDAVKELKQEIEDLKNGIIDLDLNGISRAAKGFEALKKAEQELEELEIDSIVRRAKLNAEISDLIKLTRDETIAYSERQKALVQARKIQQEIFEIDEAIAEGKLEQIKISNSLTKSTRDDLRKQAEAEAELFRIRKEFNDKDRELLNRQNELNNKILAARKKDIVEIQEIEARTYESKVEIVEKTGELDAELIENQNLTQQELLNISQEYLNESLDLLAANYDERFAIAQRFTNSVLELQQKVLDGEEITLADGAMIAKGVSRDILTDKKNRLNQELEAYKEFSNNQINEFEEGSEHRQKLEAQQAKKIYDIQLKQFKLNKAQSLLEVAINTALAVSKVWGQTGVGGLIAQAAPIAMGITQAALIASKKPPPDPSFSKGGILDGPSHKFGGVKLFGKKGGYYGEAEGGEPILTKGVSKNPTLLKAASEINVKAGGKPLVKSNYMQDGGIATNQGIDLNMLSQMIGEQLRENPPIVNVKDIISGVQEKSVEVENGVV